jgi:hypothetical protein
MRTPRAPTFRTTKRFSTLLPGLTPRALIPPTTRMERTARGRAFAASRPTSRRVYSEKVMDTAAMAPVSIMNRSAHP